MSLEQAQSALNETTETIERVRRSYGPRPMPPEVGVMFAIATALEGLLAMEVGFAQRPRWSLSPPPDPDAAAEARFLRPIGRGT